MLNFKFSEGSFKIWTIIPNQQYLKFIKKHLYSSFLIPYFLIPHRSSKMLLIKLIFLSLFAVYSCERDVANQTKEEGTVGHPVYNTRNVIIVVIDGPRYSETFADEKHQYNPGISSLLPEGVFFSGFYNQGPTYTNSGYTAITTGNYQEVDNSGQELPQNPSLFQYWLKKNNKPAEACWIFQSKGKLGILADCINEDWNGRFNPAANCGSDGAGNGNREDSITLSVAIGRLKQHHPSLALIGFKEPDHSGHQNNWNGYLEGIRKTDEYVLQLWNFIQSDPFYKNTTSFFVTNDHGRHLDGVNGGFANHGDGCEGCRHISLFAYGPDFISGKTIENRYDLPDISATIAELLNFEITTGKGEPIKEIFRK